jgi:iron complex outermembrane receptor protein
MAAQVRRRALFEGPIWMGALLMAYKRIRADHASTKARYGSSLRRAGRVWSAALVAALALASLGDRARAQAVNPTGTPEPAAPQPDAGAPPTAPGPSAGAPVPATPSPPPAGAPETPAAAPGSAPPAAPPAPIPPPQAASAPPLAGNAAAVAQPADPALALPPDDAPYASSLEGPTDEVVVTGSRIRRKDLSGPAPVVVFTREQILASGRTNIGDFLQTMPEQSNAVNRGTNNSGEGTIRVNLRGIGEQSTLVLLNGRRLAAGGVGADDSVDFSSIPSNLIERVEVLKDGASAIYGSDAIAGVINIITRKRFDGVEANAYASGSTWRDGEQIDVNGTLGSSNARGGVLFSAGYANAAPVWAGNRDYSRIQYGLDLSGGGAGVPYEFGSSIVPGGTIVLSAPEYGAQNGNSFYNDIARTETPGDLVYDQEMKRWRAFRGSNLDQDGYNFQPYNYLVTPQQRFNAFSSGDYELSKNVRVFFDSFYTKRNSAQTLAPEPLSLDGEGVIVSAQNVYNPFGRDFDAVRRRLVEFGRRTTEQDSHTFHVTAGLDGDLPESAGPLEGWFWEAAFNFNRNEATEIKTGNLRIPKLQDALGPSFVDASGTPRCGTREAAIEGCVPLNLFGGAGSITRDQVDPLTYTGVKRGYNELIGAQANLSGELFPLWAQRPAGLAVGYEFRSVSGGIIPDPITAAGETTGPKEFITEGSYRVHEIYGELSIPIVDKLPAVEMLEAIVATRGSFYDTFGSTFNYKFGGRWSPTPDFSLRGTYSTAFRAPAIPELYGGIEDSFAPVTDPCATGVMPNSALARACGDAANNGDGRSQILSRIGGYAGLEPETAKIFTAGVVVQPRALKGLSLTFDYFNTRITQRIADIGAATILQGCYSAAADNDPRYCDMIARDPVSQRITSIQNIDTNVGEDHVDGIDVSGNYQFPSPAGTFNVLGALAYLRRYDRTLADGTVIRGAGNFDLSDGGRGGAFPHVRFNVGVDWAYDGLSAGIRSYFIGSYEECGNSLGDLSGDGLCYTPDHVGERTVDAYHTWDLVIGYGFKSGAGTTSLSLGASNIFDVRPPLVYNGFLATSDSYSYDMVMRQVYARLSHTF